MIKSDERVFFEFIQRVSIHVSKPHRRDFPEQWISSKDKKLSKRVREEKAVIGKEVILL